jgi:hypothetical protein
MYSCLDKLRDNLANLIARLFNDIENLKIGVIAHGDYCDEKSTYLMKQIELTDNKKKLIDFVKTVERTGGGDFPEAYEYVLHKAQNLNWDGDTKILVLIGDATPHEKNDKNNIYNLDWKIESQKLASMDINIYGVRCLNNSQSVNFYKTISKISNGYYLEMSELTSIGDLIMTVCYKQVDDEEVKKYEREMVNEGRMTGGMRKVVDVILERKTTGTHDSDYVNLSGIVAAQPSWDSAKYEILDVQNKCSVKTFLKEKKFDWNAGNVYCELTKPLLISNNQNFIVIDKDNGNIYEGNESKKILGLKSFSYKKQKVKLMPKYRTFMKCLKQTTNLIPTTKVLYQNNDVIVV